MTLIQGTILPSISKVLGLVRLSTTLGTGIGLIERSAIGVTTSLIQTGTTSLTAITSIPGLPLGAVGPLTQMKSTFGSVIGTLNGLIK